MKNVNDNFFDLCPVKEYKAPDLPTLEDTQTIPVLLKRLPVRWKKNAAIITCIGLMGSFSLAGCVKLSAEASGDIGNYSGGYSSIYSEESSYRYAEANNGRYTEVELAFRIHTGGSGAGPFYFVHITEQEALGIIRAQLESAGLSFYSRPPNYTVRHTDFHGRGLYDLNLFDKDKGVAVSYVKWEERNSPVSWSLRGNFIERIAEDFRQQAKDIHVGVIYNPDVDIRRDLEMFMGWRWATIAHRDNQSWTLSDNPRELSDSLLEDISAAMDVARPILVERLNDQVQEFITFLQNEGII